MMTNKSLDSRVCGNDVRGKHLKRLSFPRTRESRFLATLTRRMFLTCSLSKAEVLLRFRDGIRIKIVIATFFSGLIAGFGYLR